VFIMLRGLVLLTIAASSCLNHVEGKLRKPHELSLLHHFDTKSGQLTRCCQAGEASGDEKEPCIPCSQTDHVNPQKCPCPKEGMPKYPGKSFGCVKVRCADPPGDISQMPKRCPDDKFCGAATGTQGLAFSVMVGAALLTLARNF